MSEIPTLFDWAGGTEAIERLSRVFYARVPGDPILAPVFARMSGNHAAHVAMFLCEVLGGPTTYSQQLGGHPAMIRHHLGKHLTEQQRHRWASLMGECFDEAKLPDDPEFRSALVAYVEWGSRLAVVNSQDGAAVDENAPMPKWGWGVPGGPYLPKK